MSQYRHHDHILLSEDATSTARCRDYGGHLSEMAERALLVQRDSTGYCAVSASHWGGSERAIAAICGGQSPTTLPGVSWEPRGEVTGFLSVVGSLDYLSTAALYRIRDESVTVFLPLWFGLPLTTASASPRVGGLVTVDSLSDVRATRRWFRRLKGRLTDSIAAGHVSPSVAPLVLYRAIVTQQDCERYVTALPGTAERFSVGTGPDTP